jgi:F0F1-type ATP synthase membrane subunit c/vacuolar-type H+-ATPase subunit K
MEFVPASFESFKMVGAGMAAISLVGAGAGVGIVFHAFISAFGRNPDLRGPLLQLTLMGFALTEAVGLLGLMVTFIILYK